MVTSHSPTVADYFRRLLLNSPGTTTAEAEALLRPAPAVPRPVPSVAHLRKRPKSRPKNPPRPAELPAEAQAPFAHPPAADSPTE